MKDVKVSPSKNYHEYLLKALQDPERAAGNIEVALEIEAGKPEPEILQLTLKDVIDSRLAANNLSPEAKLHYEKLEKILSETKGTEIFTFIELLSALGFRLAVISK
ncbi:MAG: transcriptional regulator [Oscillatoria sp. PMC 1068.18]|nr:transcriptional regulator [Oscillatoria sp. PMC 1076.18]MEC4987749.1 transcriptional regulator [Oscillatoria sp. PMC 1068.18]